jgi:hypothetical protein
MAAGAARYVRAGVLPHALCPARSPWQARTHVARAYIRIEGGSTRQAEEGSACGRKKQVKLALRALLV